VLEQISFEKYLCIDIDIVWKKYLMISINIFKLITSKYRYSMKVSEQFKYFLGTFNRKKEKEKQQIEKHK